jgi:hypothetical protein
MNARPTPRRAVCWTAFAASKQFHDEAAPRQVCDAVEELEDIVDTSDLPPSFWSCTRHRPARRRVGGRQKRKRTAPRCAAASFGEGFDSWEGRADENAAGEGGGDGPEALPGICEKRTCVSAVGKGSPSSHGAEGASCVDRVPLQDQQEEF